MAEYAGYAWVIAVWVCLQRRGVVGILRGGSLECIAC